MRECFSAVFDRSTKKLSVNVVDVVQDSEKASSYGRFPHQKGKKKKVQNFQYATLK